MAVRTRRTNGIALGSSRVACRLGLGVILLALGGYGLQFANAIGDTRTISMHHVHTNEDITITYKRNGRYDEEALKKINWFLRDWRRNEQTAMSPQLIDLLWEVHREVGAKAPIYVVCGYRAPETNAMLRARSSGVALFSQHMIGNATDFFIPGVPIEQLRVVAMRLQDGGVGYYPTSGSPFVHLDVGNVRHWPRMTREELVKVFPDERTVHIPADGHPLAGYALALADLSRGARGSRIRPTMIARVSDTHEDDEIATGSTRLPPMPVARPASLASLASKSTPQAQNKPANNQVAMAASTQPVTKAKLDTNAISPASIFLPWPTTGQQVDRVSPEVALAYAAVAHYEPSAPTALENVQRPIPVSASKNDTMARTAPQNLPRQSPIAATLPKRADPALAKGLPASPSGAGAHIDNPWIRAVVLAPSIYTFMTTSQFNPLDPRQIGSLLQKPTSAVAMTFSADPYAGMTTTEFRGRAVQFLATVSFGMRTAALH
ncbi:MAG TPA: DUF882 domain-containing protein [Xanthobacteraceae bacterium]|nr:DUF882 domain-containing protein [Xanthobacteraceae bacterium]